MTKVMEQCESVRARHERKEPSEYIHDAVYRALVTEMLDTQKYALAKMDYLLSTGWYNGKFFKKEFVAMPLRMAFRDHMLELAQKQEASPSREKATELCRLNGLLVHDVAEKNELEETPLMSACADGVTDDKLKLLLQAGSDVNLKMDYEGIMRKGMNPLLTASLYGRMSTVSALVANGGDVSAVDGDGTSCMYFAAHGGHLTTLEVLSRLDADASRPDKNIRGPVWISACNGHASVVEFLSRLGADICKQDTMGRSPTWKAAQNGHTSVVEVLHRLGADISTPDSNKCTPVWIASLNGHASVVEVLHRLGANISTPKNNGCTP